MFVFFSAPFVERAQSFCIDSKACSHHCVALPGQELAAARSFNATLRVSSGCRNNTACDSLDPQTVDLLSSSGSCDLIVVAAGLTADARESNAAEGGTNACGCPEGLLQKEIFFTICRLKLTLQSPL